ncbi:reverse transcriptase [Phytophthora megakarya]|uniref:Reverse transcriptase n=1 Tax=Phytophthora megakarya TaxID=4795 RepID=A0A225W9B7_9STRA|nr:reverse transcriptase [Phytophthora megakarya]
MVQLQERPEGVDVLLAARREATPKPEASALQVKDPTDVPSPEQWTLDMLVPKLISQAFVDMALRIGVAVPLTNPPNLESEARTQNLLGLGRLSGTSRLRNERRFRFVPEFDSEDILENVFESALDDFSHPMDDASDLSDTPVQSMEREYERVMRVTVEDLDLEPAVYLREGTELLAQLSDHLTMFPELEELIPECDIDKADVGEPGVTTPEMEDKMRKILNYHRRIFLSDGNAAPAPARGVVCELGVGDATPIALRARQIASRYLVKVYELLKKLLETGLIEHSESEWSFPIVIV